MTLELLIPPPARPPTLHSLDGSSVVGDAFRHPPTLTAGCGCLWPLCCSFVFVAAETTRSAAPVPCGADRHHLHGGRVPGTVFRGACSSTTIGVARVRITGNRSCMCTHPALSCRPVRRFGHSVRGTVCRSRLLCRGEAGTARCQPFDRGTATCPLLNPPKSPDSPGQQQQTLSRRSPHSSSRAACRSSDGGRHLHTCGQRCVVDK